ncbi:MAG: tyrosine-type recombinase/integrase [Dehalococcoidia bacterium]|nr:tyrosine-type recombinase/integrase [Dehalococcoidia bacterium]
MEFYSLLLRLSPAKQRLVRELVWNLAQLETLTIPADHDARLEYLAHVDGWLTSLVARSFAPETLRRYSRQVHRLLKANPHPTQGILESALAAEISAGRTAGTVSRMLEAFRSFYSYLADRGLISINAAAKIPKPQDYAVSRQPASQLQVDAVFKSAKSLKHQVQLMLFVDCGLRVRELAFARISKIDIEAKSIAVIGKGSKPRSVPMSSVTAEFVSSQIQDIRSLGYTGDWLFPGRDASKPTNPDAIRTFFYHLCDRAGVKRFSPHQLRHYFATATLSAGASLKAISSILGHARTSTTVNTYWHIVEQGEVSNQHARYSPLQQQMKGAGHSETLGE